MLAALEAVDPEGRSASHSDSSANPLDRLARGVFVGRERELEQLRGRWTAALDGRGSVVMLVGEPGIREDTHGAGIGDVRADAGRGDVLLGERTSHRARLPTGHGFKLGARGLPVDDLEEIANRREWQPYAVETPAHLHRTSRRTVPRSARSRPRHRF